MLLSVIFLLLNFIEMNKTNWKNAKVYFI